MVQSREDVVGLDSSVILPRQTWEASGHVETFTDPLTECQSCHKRFRADHLQEAAFEKKPGDASSTAAGKSSASSTEAELKKLGEELKKADAQAKKAVEIANPDAALKKVDEMPKTVYADKANDWMAHPESLKKTDRFCIGCHE